MICFLNRPNQFVASVVIRDAEFDNSSLWDNPRNHPAQLNGRLAFILNSNDKRREHGEKMLTDQYLDEMIAACGEPCMQNPVVVVYSHYIPCSCINDTRYECAMWLPDWLEQYRYDVIPGASLIVGYSKSFCGYRSATNKQRSLWYMYVGDVPTYVWRRTRFVARQPDASQPAVSQDTVQRRLYDCLVGIHMFRNDAGHLEFFRREAYACVDGYQVELMFSYTINYMMYQFAISPHIGSPIRDVIKQWTFNYIRNSIKSNCPETGHFESWMWNIPGFTQNMKLMYMCTNWAADTARFFGFPLVDPDLTNQQLSDKWGILAQRLDADSPRDSISDLRAALLHATPSWVDFRRGQPLVSCKGNGRLDLKLLCSRSHTP